MTLGSLNVEKTVQTLSRSNIFSLEAVLYELLDGRPPFRGDTKSELPEQVTRYEPRPLSGCPTGAQVGWLGPAARTIDCSGFCPRVVKMSVRLATAVTRRALTLWLRNAGGTF